MCVLTLNRPLGNTSVAAEAHAMLTVVADLEGTRFTPKKHQEALDFSKKRDLPQLDHVLLPRSKGFVAAVKELRGSHIQHVYDLTLVYAGPKAFQQAPSMAKILGTPRLSPIYHFHVHAKRWAFLLCLKRAHYLSELSSRVGGPRCDHPKIHVG